MTITADIQSLEPGHRIQLFEVDCSEIGGDVLRFHGHSQSESIAWQGLEYKPWPIQGAGFERTSDARQPSPTLTVGDINGTITALCIALDDLVGAKVFRRRTLAKYLDAINFPVEQVVSNQRFATGDGVTRAYQLVGPDSLPVVRDVNVSAIRRSDWQGDRLLYPTPRTNQFINSQNFAASGWQRSLLSVSSDPGMASPNPDDAGGVQRLIPSTASGAHYLDQHASYDAGLKATRYGFFKAGSLNLIELRVYGSPTNSYSGILVDLKTGQFKTIGNGTYERTYWVNGLRDGWWEIGQTVAFPADTGTDHIFRAIVWTGTLDVPTQMYAGDGTSFLYHWAQHCELGDVAGAYIPTAGAAKTATDYALAPDGVVQFASAPARSSALTWSGSGVAGNNPTADPNEKWPDEQWRIEQKSDEQPGVQVEFTLSSPLDFGGQQVPARQMVGMCQWRYRGPECGYTAMVFFDKNDMPVGDPALDRCSQKTSGCECRFGVNNPLSWGGFLCDTLA